MEPMKGIELGDEFAQEFELRLLEPTEEDTLATKASSIDPYFRHFSMTSIVLVRLDKNLPLPRSRTTSV